MARKVTVTDVERQLLQKIANLCNEASDTIEEKDNFLTAILSECDKTADMINEYLDY